MIRSIRAWATALPVILVGCGAGSQDVSLAPVSGTVTLDGEPLADASVQFQPDTDDMLAPSSYGLTDAQGRYSLELLSSGESGAVPGEHLVSITLPIEDKMVNGEYMPGDGQLPTQYNQDTTLTMTVPEGGRDDADFPLVSDSGSQPEPEAE